MEKVKVIAPAKINLSLNITGTDSRGYHLLDMVMQAVSVFEKVDIKKADRGITLSSNARYIPTDERNVAYKAAREFFAATGISGGAEIFIKKRIPIKAGMGGGSADAAAVLKGLDRLYGTYLSTAQLCEIGAKAGSDVPFMIAGGTRRVGGTGEILSPCPPLPDCHIVICMPYRGVSTPAAFAKFDRLGEKTFVDTDGLIEAMAARDIKKCARLMANDLEKAADLDRIYRLKKSLCENGALGALMTGSGAAVFGIFDDEAAAKAALQNIKRACRSIFLAKPVNYGAKIIRRE